MASATSPLHWPTKERPSDSAAYALYFNDKLQSTILLKNISCKSALDLPA